MSRHIDFHSVTLARGSAMPGAGRRRLRVDATPDPLRHQIDALGRNPKPTLEAFVDLGLSDADIGRYFGVPSDCISKLRRIWNIRRCG